MIRNYFISTLRNLLRNKVFSLINIIGFAAGIACVILFYMWVSDEVSYDRFHKNRDRIFNLLSVFPRDAMNSMSVTPFPLAPALSDNHPEVEAYSRYWQFPSLVTHGEISFMNEKVHLVDPGFLEMFSFPVISGDPEEAFTSRSAVAITQSEALKYFGTEDPVGKILTFNKELELSVVAVLEDPPENSVFDFSMLGSILHVPEFRLYSDWSYAGPSYIMLSDGENWRSFQEKVEGIYKEINPNTTTKLLLQPLKEIYLYEDGKASRIVYVLMFSGIALVILVLACINYMNLSTARSLKRTREIGMRKTNGASRRQVIVQFLIESMFYSLISLFLALILVELVRPLFNTLTLKNLEIHYTDPLFLSVLLIIYIFTSLVSGLYPAFVLSSYNPVKTVAGNGIVKGGKHFLHTLIVLQFTISIALIIASVTVNRQVGFIEKNDLGMNKENVIVLPFGGDMIPIYDVLREELMSNPSVLNVSASYDLPFFLTSGVSFTWEDVDEDDRISVSYNMVDYDFMETLEIEMLEGRSFSREYADDDSLAYIINETAMREMGVDHATGLDIQFRHPHLPEHYRKGSIIGVVKDFNIRPLKEQIAPLVLKIHRPWYRHLYIRYQQDKLKEVLLYLETVQASLYPGLPFDYSFLDQEADQIYDVEIRTGRIIRYFTWISILISILGLLGMVIYDLELRKREIAIRKVLASSVRQIILLILYKYLRWIAMAYVIASPLAYFLTRRWLQEFAYGIRISPLTYLLSLVVVVLITCFSIGILSRRSARTNPARVLMDE